MLNKFSDFIQEALISEALVWLNFAKDEEKELLAGIKKLGLKAESPRRTGKSYKYTITGDEKKIEKFIRDIYSPEDRDVARDLVATITAK